MNKVVRTLLALAVSTTAVFASVQPAQAVCSAWCAHTPLSTAAVIDFQFVYNDQYYAVARTSTVTIYSSDSKTSRLTVSAPSGKSFRGMKATNDGRYLFVFSDRTVTRIDLSNLSSTDSTPASFENLWAGVPATMFDSGVLGGIYDLAPLPDGSAFYAVTNDDYAAAVRKVTVATKSVSAEITNGMWGPGNKRVFATILSSGKLLQLSQGVGPNDYADSVLWDLSDTENSECFDVVGYSFIQTSATQIGYLAWDSGTRFRSFNPASISSGSGCIGPGSQTDVFLHYATGTKFVGATGLVKMADGSYYTNDFNSVLRAGVPYLSPIVKINASTGVLTKVTNTTIVAESLARDSLGTVLVAYGTGGVQAVTVGAPVAAPNRVSISRTSSGVYAMSWSLVNLKPGAVVKDYVIQFKRTSNGAISTVADGVSVNQYATVRTAYAGKYQVKVVYTNGEVSAWSPWVSTP